MSLRSKHSSPASPLASDAAATLTRRTVLTRLVVGLPLAAAAPALFTACAHGPKCEDTSGLTPDETRMRTEIAAYQEQAPDQAKRCANCVQFVPGGKDACGSCKVVKGPINPGGTCKLFVAKPA